MTDISSSPAPVAERKKLTPAAERALAEAEARRKAAAASAMPHAEGVSGSEGPGTDPIWRLGAQRDRVGFLRSKGAQWERKGPLPDDPTQPLVGNMPPYERTNAYRSSRRGPWRRWFSAALPWVFVVGVAAGTMLPVRDWVRRSLPGSADSQAARDAEMIWKRAGNSDLRVIPSM